MTTNRSSSADFNAAGNSPPATVVTAFFAAVAQGNALPVREMLDSFPALLEWREATRGATPLIMAARHGQPAMLALLLNTGANPLAEDNAGMNALVNAASEGQQAACHYLMERGFDPTKGNRTGMTAISAARAADFPGLAESLARDAPLYRDIARAAWKQADVDVGTRLPVAPMKRLAFKQK